MWRAVRVSFSLRSKARSRRGRASDESEFLVTVRSCELHRAERFARAVAAVRIATRCIASAPDRRSTLHALTSASRSTHSAPASARAGCVGAVGSLWATGSSASRTA